MRRKRLWRGREDLLGTARLDLGVALDGEELPAALVSHYRPELELNRDTVTCLRSCLMKPEHLDWVDDVCATLDDIAERLA